MNKNSEDMEQQINENSIQTLRKNVGQTTELSPQINISTPGNITIQ